MSKSTCNTDQCTNLGRVKGYCDRHYREMKRAGLLVTIYDMTEVERFWYKVDKSGECWDWTCNVGNTGYGVFYKPGPIRVSAHRYSYELANGPIPEGMYIDHLCHNKVCVNPSHLRAVTNKQNAEHLRGARPDNKSSGVRNVYLTKSRKNPWCVRVGHHGTHHYFGSYPTIEEADQVARAVRARLFTHDDAHLWGKEQRS